MSWEPLVYGERDPDWRKGEVWRTARKEPIYRDVCSCCGLYHVSNRRIGRFLDTVKLLGFCAYCYDVLIWQGGPAFAYDTEQNFLRRMNYERSSEPVRL